MLAQRKEEEFYTSDEYLEMTGLEGRHELINGYIYDMSPAPTILHQRISGNISTHIRNYIKKNHGKCEVLEAPTDIRLNDYSTVQPDVFVVCDPDKLDEKRCNGAPDWVIEILSPSSIGHDMSEKLYLYSASGVKEYWIIDPMKEKVVVYLFGNPNIIGIYTFEDDVPVDIFKNDGETLAVCISKLLQR